MEFFIGFCHPKHSKFRGGFNGLCALVLFIFLFYQKDIFTSPFLRQSLILSQSWNLRGGLLYDGTNRVGVIRRKIGELSFNSSNFTDFGSAHNDLSTRDPTVCNGLHEHKGNRSQCEFLTDNPQCISGGLFNYIRFFYCGCEKYSFLGYLTLAIWFAALFYLLGNTASDYFCCSLEKLSNFLNLPPTVAGVTLLPLGNGAPDVFASIAAFVGSDAGDVGLNSVLGGAVFVTCVVVGTVSFCVADQRVQIDKRCFIRDVCFFLFALICLLVVLILGEVSVGGAIAFVAIYVVYAFSVVVNEILRKHSPRLKQDSVTQLLPVSRSMFSHENGEDEHINVALLESESGNEVPHLQTKLPHWMWASHVAIYDDSMKASLEESPKPLWGWNDEETVENHSSFSFSKLCSLLVLPLLLPGRLTIPVIEDDRWSKGYAVASASLAPMLLAFLWNTQDDVNFLSGEIAYLVGATVVYLVFLHLYALDWISHLKTTYCHGFRGASL